MRSTEQRVIDAYEMIRKQMQVRNLSYAVLPGLIGIHPDKLDLLRDQQLGWTDLEPLMDMKLSFWNEPVGIRD